ncbi:MAG TPA: ribbon-helix-helix domain-containing protein [Azospirillaceae bacterium]|nr:ribbon-helix-helix domain-containing protein [Azospirillaceae bacterium]
MPKLSSLPQQVADAPLRGSPSLLRALDGLPENEAPAPRTVRIAGKRTSMRIEPAFWAQLCRIAAAEGLAVEDLVALIAGNLQDVACLTRAIRVFVVLYGRSAAPVARTRLGRTVERSRRAASTRPALSVPSMPGE